MFKRSNQEIHISVHMSCKSPKLGKGWHSLFLCDGHDKVVKVIAKSRAKVIGVKCPRHAHLPYIRYPLQAQSKLSHSFSVTKYDIHPSSRADVSANRTTHQLYVNQISWIISNKPNKVLNNFIHQQTNKKCPYPPQINNGPPLTYPRSILTALLLSTAGHLKAAPILCQEGVGWRVSPTTMCRSFSHSKLHVCDTFK